MKHLLTLAAILGLSVSLVGCGGAKEEPKPAAPAASSGEAAPAGESKPADAAAPAEEKKEEGDAAKKE